MSVCVYLYIYIYSFIVCLCVMVNDHLESLISRNIPVSDPFHPPRFSDPHTTKANFGPAAMAPRLEFDEWGDQWGG